jgi:hypothetical protein
MLGLQVGYGGTDSCMGSWARLSGGMTMAAWTGVEISQGMTVYIETSSPAQFYTWCGRYAQFVLISTSSGTGGAYIFPSGACDAYDPFGP